MTRTPPDIVPVTAASEAFGQLAALFDAYRVHHGEAGDRDSATRWLADQSASQRLSLTAALDGDRVLGFMTHIVLPASLTLGIAWMIRDLYVDPAHRRSGVATALLRHAVAAARAAGARRLSLQTESTNAVALTLYGSLGFEPVDGIEILNLPLSRAI